MMTHTTETSIHVIICILYILVKLHETQELNNCLGSPGHPLNPLDCVSVFGYPTSRYASSHFYISSQSVCVFSPTFHTLQLQVKCILQKRLSKHCYQRCCESLMMIIHFSGKFYLHIFQDKH